MDPSNEITPLLPPPSSSPYPPPPPTVYSQPGYPQSGYAPSQSGYQPSPYGNPPANSDFGTLPPPASSLPPTTLSSLSSSSSDSLPLSSLPPTSALPPAYVPTPIPNANGMLEVPCRVCSHPIEYTARPNLSAIRCNRCHHATQVGPPPAGKIFVLCHCNTLLTVNNTAKAATCPKENCKRTLILAPEAPGKCRSFCAHCNCLLSYSASSAVVICPKCLGRSVVSRSKLNWYIGLNFTIAIIFITLGIGLTMTSYMEGGGVFFVFWGLILAGILSLIRAGMYAGLNYRARDAIYVPV